MVQGKWFAPGTDAPEGFDIRKSVFQSGRDSLDALSWNVVVYQDGVPAATGRIWWDDGAYRLGGIGVLPSHRGRGLGDLVLRLLLFKAQSHFAREVRLSSPSDCADFFSRLGFRRDPALAAEGGTAEMLLPGDQIDLDTCKNCHRKDCPSRKEA